MENRNYYPVRIGKNSDTIVSDIFPGRLTYTKDQLESEFNHYGGFLLAESVPNHVAKQFVEAYNEKYGPKVKHQLNKTYSEPTLDEMIAWTDSIKNGIVITDAEITTHIRKALVLIRESDMISSFNKFMENVPQEKLDEMLTEINGPVITDADLISTALQEGSITTEQAIQLHEVVETSEFKNLFIQMQYESKASKLMHKKTKDAIAQFNIDLLEHRKIEIENKSMIAYVDDEFNSFLNLLNKFVNTDYQASITEAAKFMTRSVLNGSKLLSCGNGGSYSDAQHFASELSGKYRGVRPAIAAIALSDGGAMSCIANDFGYAHVFERQVEAIGKSGDVLLCLSTSGNSENVILAAKRAKEICITTVGICGNSGGELKKHLDILIEVPHSGDAGKIQEVTIIVIHILVGLIEKGIA